MSQLRASMKKYLEQAGNSPSTDEADFYQDLKRLEPLEVESTRD